MGRVVEWGVECVKGLEECGGGMWGRYSIIRDGMETFMKEKRSTVETVDL